MIRGLEIFRERLGKYKDEYIIIGGVACSLLLADKDTAFRATKDFDIVLIATRTSEDFAKAFRAFIREGGYKNKQKSDGQAQFYRFEKPEHETFPYMLELFSSSEAAFERGNEDLFIKIELPDDVSSLSAILLNEDYYKLLLSGKKEIDGIQVLSAEYLILFKAKAWLDLTDKKAKDIAVDSFDIKKHRNDIFRLFRLLTGQERIPLPPQVKEDMRQFLQKMADEDVPLAAMEIRTEKAEILKVLSKIYLSDNEI